MEKDQERRFTIPRWIVNVGKVVAFAGLAVVAGAVAIATQSDDRDDEVSCEDDYVPFTRTKKEHNSDFELADFCRGGDLTED